MNEAPYRSLMREYISKSCGRKRRALPPQCAEVPPTISPGLNAPISRIGNAVCASLLRNVRVSRDRFWKMSLCRSNFSSSYTLGFAKSVLISNCLPRSRHTTLNPALASSIDMIEPTTPLPTTTTSTDFNFVLDISASPVAIARDDDVLRKAFRIDRHLTGLDVEHADGFGAVRLTAGDQFAVLTAGHSGESEQLPAHFVAIAAVQRVGEVPLFGVAPQHVEEEFR